MSNLKQVQGMTTRYAAAQLVHQILVENANLEEAFDNCCSFGILKSEPEIERAFCRSMVTNTIRRNGLFDFILKKYMKKRPSGIAMGILATALEQMLFMRVPNNIAISIAIEITKADKSTKHLPQFISAVLRRVEADSGRINSLINKPGVNLPQWLYSRWQRNYGSDTARMISEANLVDPDLDITVKSRPETWAEILNAEVLFQNSLRIKNFRGRPEDLPGYDSGDWWIQDLASSLPATFLGNVENKFILDLCAAPGGKTAQLANAGANITALDISEHRMKRLLANFHRLGLSVNSVISDALTYQSSEKFDGILLDAPCSATGTVRRHPDIAWHRTEKQIGELAALQFDLIVNASKLLKSGGTLVFSTCSIEPEEGESHLLKSLPDLEFSPILKDEVPALGILSAKGFVRSLPQLGLDGFFIARFKKL